MNDIDSFRIHDSGIHIWTNKKTYDFRAPRGKEAEWASYKVICGVLELNGYVFHEDPRYRNSYWKSLRRTHHAGSKGDVHFHSEIYPAGFKFEFYEDVVRDNRHGARYDFDKMGQAPYLWRKRVELIHTRIVDALMTMGFKDQSPLDLDGAALNILERRRQDLMFCPSRIRDYYTDKPDRYSHNDQDRVALWGGETRYFYTRNGRLQRGRIYRALGNVWPVALNRTEWTHECTSDLFTYDPAKHPRKLSVKPIIKISAALRQAVEKRDYRRAAVIQDAMDRMVKSYSFKAGDVVDVDNPRFHGRGTVDYIDPPFWVGVKLDNDNIWAYEWATVKPAAAEVVTT